MNPSEQLLDDLAGTVLDGDDVDWSAAESSADAEIRPLLQCLRVVASLAEVHRPTLSAEGETWGHLRILERVKLAKSSRDKSPFLDMSESLRQFWGRHLSFGEDQFWEIAREELAKN